MDRREMFQGEAARLKKKGNSDVTFWRPEVDKNVVRILPHWSGDREKVFYKKMRVHFGVGSDKQRVVCRKNLGKDERCPVCEYAEELVRSPRKEDVQAGKDIMGRDRYAVNMINVQDPQAGVLVWEMGKGLFNDILLFFLDDQFMDLDSLDAGRHITVNRVGKGKLDTRYTVYPMGTPSKVSPKVMEKVTNLDNIYPVLTIEEVAAALSGEEFASEAADPKNEFLAGEVENPLGGDAFDGGHAAAPAPLGEDLIEDAGLLDPTAFAKPSAPAATPAPRASRLSTMRDALAPGVKR